MDERQHIYQLDPKRIWTVDRERKDLDQRKGASPFFIVDELIAQIRHSNIFICVLRDVYGSSVFGDTESVSFLETEIYQAALFRNNVRFFLMEPFNPSEKLKGLLDLVRAVRPGIIPERAYPERIILDEIKCLLDANPSRPRRPWTVSVRGYVSQLAFRRGHPNPDLELFDKVFRPVSAKPDRDHIRILLDGLKDEQSIEKRLTRTWVALRELCAAPYDDSTFKEYLPLWNEVLGVWSSAASWYGLHGHLYAGRLAAVNSQLAIRARIDWKGAGHRSEHYIQGTKGARASEYYSMAKLMTGRRQRDEYLRLAEDDVNDALRSIEDDPSGYFAIRGHIHLIQNRLDAALEDFRQASALRKAKHDAKAAAEADADIALVLMRRGEYREAVRILRESAAALEAEKSITFAIRVRKRLAAALLRSGHPFQAWGELDAAYQAAVENQVFDQITPTMEMANRLAAALGRSAR
jgi:tetratricopeptide (TPR) repeat protein